MSNKTKINLEDIRNIPEDEFKQQITDWIEYRGIPKCLKSKLRKDLFDNINKTSLGRQIASQFQQNHRIILSPLILVLNTLVAEFLYSQDCHFTLSVFATEVPYKHALPDFESSQHFRFNEYERLEIFDAIGIRNNTSGIDKNIDQMYTEKATATVINNSLLYCLLKILLPSKDEKLIKATEFLEKPSHAVATEFATPTSKCKTCLENKHSNREKLDSRYFKQFTQYLEVLSKHVIKMTKSVDQLSRNKVKHGRDGNRLYNLNKSLDKVNEKLKNLSKSKKASEKVADLLLCITKLTGEIEKCGDNFERLLLYSQDKVEILEPKKVENKLQESTNVDVATTTGSYSDWVRQLKNSKFGQRFIGHLEAFQQKTIAKEVEKMKKQFEEKLETNRKLLKLHYKQKMLEKYKGAVTEVNANQLQINEFTDAIDTKLKELKAIEEECAKSLKEKEQEELKLIQEKFAQITAIKEDAQPEKVEKKLSYHKAAIVNIEPPVVITTNHTISVDSKAPPHIDHIVQVAKNRLKELEVESEALDKSFQTYLQKQNEEKQKLNLGSAKILENYEFGKNLLSQVVPSKKVDVSNNQTTYKANLCDVPETIHQSNKLINSTTAELNEMQERIKQEIQSIRNEKLENPYRSYETALMEKKSQTSHYPTNEIKQNVEDICETLRTLRTSYENVSNSVNAIDKVTPIIESESPHLLSVNRKASKEFSISTNSPIGEKSSPKIIFTNTSPRIVEVKDNTATEEIKSNLVETEVDAYWRKLNKPPEIVLEKTEQGDEANKNDKILSDIEPAAKNKLSPEDLPHKMNLIESAVDMYWKNFNKTEINLEKDKSNQITEQTKDVSNIMHTTEKDATQNNDKEKPPVSPLVIHEPSKVITISSTSDSSHHQISDNEEILISAGEKSSSDDFWK